MKLTTTLVLVCAMLLSASSFAADTTQGKAPSRVRSTATVSASAEVVSRESIGLVSDTKPAPTSAQTAPRKDVRIDENGTKVITLNFE